MSENPVYAKITNFLIWFNSLWNFENPVTLDQVENFFAADIKFYLNSQLMATGIHAYLERLNALKRKCKLLNINLPAQQILIEGHRAAVNWTESLTFHDGTVRHMVNAAFIHFNHEGKIVEFSDIFNGTDPVN